MAGYDSVGSMGTASNPFSVTTAGGTAPGNLAVEGNSPAGSADTGNPVMTAGVDSGNVRRKIRVTNTGISITGISAAAGDAIANTGHVLSSDGGAFPLYAMNLYFNGATWDRVRGDTNGAYAVEKNRAVFYTEAPSQTLASAAVFTGATRDVGVAAGALCAYPRFGVFVNASQAGTLTIQGSDDNFATSYVVATQTVAAATPVDVTVPVRARYHRAVFTNGATAQTSIVIKTGYQA